MTYIFTIPKCYIDFTLPKNTQCFKVVVDPGIWTLRCFQFYTVYDNNESTYRKALHKSVCMHALDQSPSAESD